MEPNIRDIVPMVKIDPIVVPERTNWSENTLYRCPRTAWK